MSILPQAYVLILRQLTPLIYPTILVIASFSFLRRLLNVVVPTWIVVIAVLISMPSFMITRAQIFHWLNARRAARLGAVLPPRWNGKRIGNLDVLEVLRKINVDGYLSDNFWEKMHELGPTYEVSIMWDPDYVTSDVNIIKNVLATDFNNWVKGEKFDAFMKSVLGTGVFNSDGDMWKFHRTMTRPFFTRDRISHFDIFDRHAEEATSKMSERFRCGFAVDFQDLISRFTLDSATEFLFGSCVDSLQSSLPYPHNADIMLRNAPNSVADDFAKAFMDMQLAISRRAISGWVWPWFELSGSSTAPAMRVVDAFLDPILKDAVEKVKSTNMSEQHNKGVDMGENDTLLDHLVRHTTDPVVLHDEVLNIMIAGRDTTAGMLTIAVYFLSQYPNVLRRLREEILEEVGQSCRPTYDDIRNMKYLRAVLNETMRLYPAVPWNMRYAVKDTVFPNSDPTGKPLFIPAGSPVSYSVHCMHRRTDYWGPDAEEFDPDRFLDYRVQKYLTLNPFIFLPFNAGPRICLGQQFAYNEMSFFLIRLLQKFETISLDTGSQPPDTRPPAHWGNCPGRKGVEKFWPKAHLTLYSAGGLWLKMTEAKV